MNIYFCLHFVFISLYNYNILHNNVYRIYKINCQRTNIHNRIHFVYIILYGIILYIRLSLVASPLKFEIYYYLYYNLYL